MGVTPIQYVDEIIANFKLLWQRLNITNNDFIRTSEERHHKVVQSILQKIFEQGDIYKRIMKAGTVYPANPTGWSVSWSTANALTAAVR